MYNKCVGTKVKEVRFMSDSQARLSYIFNLIDVLNRGDFSVSVNPSLRARGHYSVANNTFTLREDFDTNLPTALHEFLHLASTPQKINFVDSNNYDHQTGICEYRIKNGKYSR